MFDRRLGQRDFGLTSVLLCVIIGALIGLGDVDVPLIAGLLVLGAGALIGIHRPTAIFALFLMAGAFKAVLPTPFDLTVALAVLTVGLMLTRLARRGSIPNMPIPLVLYFAVVAVVGVGTLYGSGGAYGAEKALRLASLGTLSVIAPVVLVQNSSDARHFMSWLAGIGLALSAYAIGTGGSEAAYGRFVAAGSDTIWMGRAAGLAVLAASAVLFSRSRPPRALDLTAIGVGMVALIGSGSRGPVVGIVLAIGLLLVIRLATAGSRRIVLVLSVLLVVIAAVAAWNVVPEVSIERFERIFSDNPGESALARVRLISSAWDLFVSEPVTGVGTGGFAALEPRLRYPHNMFLELAAENGLFAAVFMLVLLSLALRGATRAVIRNPGSPVAAFVMMGLIFGLANAMVSSDINGHRLLFCLLPLAFTPSATFEPEECLHDEA